MIRIVLLAIALIYGFSNHVLGKTNSRFRPNKDYALFFANDDYSTNSGFKPLKNPLKDAEAIGQVLETAYDFEVHVYPNYTKRQIESTIKTWQEKTYAKDAQLFIFFSGHGAYNEFYSRGYFVPNGAKADNWEAYFNLSILGDVIAKIPCDHILLAIDACYSGTADREIIFRGPNFSRPGVTEATEKEQLIEKQLTFTSKLLVTSGGKERTPDGKDHSPFSSAILKGLRSAFTNGDGLFTFRDLLAKLERVNPTPHQGELEGHEEGGFIFVAKGNSIPASSNNKRTDQHLTNSRLDRMAETSAKRSISSFTDRDGNTYAFKTMKDGKRWMTQNLNIKIQDAYCYEDKDENCRKYGRLYTWEAAKEGCRLLGDGWRLPTDAEWKKLAESYGGFYDWSVSKDIGDPKQSYRELLVNGSSGFAALLGGIRYSSGSYYSLGASVYYWTSTESSSSTAWFYNFNGGKLWRHNYDSQAYGHSVRCLQPAR